MANSNKLQQSKANDRVPGLTGSSDSQRRFHRYCARTSLFPPPPPVPTLTAAQRLKRFKAICKKQQLAASNVKRSTKKNLAITLIVRKKGIRKSSTPGKSPFIKSARKSISRKELLRSAHAHNMKLLIAGMDNGVSDPISDLGNDEQFEQPTFSPENICDRKKELLKKLSADETKERKSCDIKPTAEPFVEYPNENGRNNSEEIDVVNNGYQVSTTNQVSTNGNVNGENSGLGTRHANNGISNENNHKNEDLVENAVVDTNPEDLELKNGSFETNGVSENASATLEIVSENVESHSEEDGDEVLGETLLEKPQEDVNLGELDEDSSFDAILQAPAEKDLSTEDNAEIGEKTTVYESASEASETIPEPSEKTSDSRTLSFTAETHSKSNKFAVEINNQNKSCDVESYVESRNKTGQSCVETKSHKESGCEESEEPSSINHEESRKKKTKPRKSSTPLKEAVPKTPASSKRTSLKRKSPLTPIIVRKPKSKKGSALEIVVEKTEEAVKVKKSRSRRVTPIFKVAPAHIESHAYFSSGDSVLGSPTEETSLAPDFSTEKSEYVASISKQKGKRGKVNENESKDDRESSSSETRVSASIKLKSPFVAETTTQKTEDAVSKSKSKKGSRKSKISTADSENSLSEIEESASPKSEASSVSEIGSEKAEAPAVKPKNKRASLNKSENPVDSFSETSVSAFVKPKTAPFLEMVIEEAEKSLISSDSENDGDFIKPSPMVRRSQFKQTEPVASCSAGKPEKTPVVTPVQLDFGEPSTSKSSGLRRTQRSFSPSRRAPLRSTRQSGTSVFESTPFDSTPLLKRKADIDTEMESAKRAKDETSATPRWNILSSPLKSYWSPQLSNKVAYKQPESSLTPDQFSTISDEETPSSSDIANESDSSKAWCTIS